MGQYIPSPNEPAGSLAKLDAKSRDFSRPFSFELQSAKPNKTVDIGRDGVSLSTDPLGRVLHFGTFHPKHGIIVAAPYEQFDGSKFYDPLYVRNYRTTMLSFVRDGTPGFGLSFGHALPSVAIQLLKWDTAAFDFNLSELLKVRNVVRVLEGGQVAQTAAVVNTSSVDTTCSVDLNLSMSLNRASYGQLTEGGPIPLPESRNELRVIDKGKSFEIHNQALEAVIEGMLLLNGTAIDMSSLENQTQVNKPLAAVFSLTIPVAAGETSIIEAIFTLSPQQNAPRRIHVDTKPVNKSLPSDWKLDNTISTYILRRNVDYILANCVVPVSKTVSAVITDHVALPLGWNRDNYWQIRLLHETYKNMDLLVKPHAREMYSFQIKSVLKGHLKWVFFEAQRPNGFWHRSYLVTGVPKDGPIFQLDQQCYPILELCDYFDLFPQETDFVAKVLHSGAVNDVLDLLQSKRDPHSGLWPTDETPGDDAVIYPYHFSSNVLLWRTMSRLRDLRLLLAPERPDEITRLDLLVEELHQNTLRFFTASHPETGSRVFSYLTDAKGKHLFYHDANDIPTLFALEWAFVSAHRDVETWKNTMKFGFSPANKGGYCSEGKYPGLGSVHSPGSWVLGYYQELEFGAAMDDVEMISDVWLHICAAMQWDGTFSEAVDPDTAACSSKAWFSWPGSMIGALIIKMRRNGTEKKLLEMV